LSDYGVSFVASALGDVFFPRQCSACESPEIKPGAHFCPKCAKDIRSVREPICTACGVPLGHGGGQALCPACAFDAPAFHRARSGFFYRGSLRSTLIKYKFGGSIQEKIPLAELFLQAFNRHYDFDEFDMIVPIPLHSRRLVQRGFNHMILIGATLAKNIGAPLERRCLIKRRNTKPQVGLSEIDRSRNLDGAFEIRDPKKIIGKRVLIIDDVFTTGATMREVAKTLKTCGAASVDALVLAYRALER
jgi:ComF family protein